MDKMGKQETMADFAAELEESYKTLEEYEQYDIPEEDMTAWETLKEMMEQGAVVSVKVTESVPAGAVAFVEEVRGFIPASKLALHYVEDTSEYVGKTLRVRVISVDPETQKLILSAKSVLQEEQENEKQHKVSMIVPGTIVEGTVESLQPYGAFVNIGDDLTGLVHISQICEKRIKKPSEVLKVGEKVKAKILNTENGKISLSIKAASEGEAEELVETAEYSDSESVSTGLGDLLAKLNL